MIQPRPIVDNVSSTPLSVDVELQQARALIDIACDEVERAVENAGAKNRLMVLLDSVDERLRALEQATGRKEVA